MGGIDVLVFCVFAYWFVKHAPELAADAIREVRAALNGDEPPDSERLRRLAEAGYGPDGSEQGFDRYWNNVKRDFWNDRDQARRRRRARRGQDPAAPGVFARLMDAVDDEVDRRATAWRERAGSRPAGPGSPRPAGGPGGGPGHGPRPGGGFGPPSGGGGETGPTTIRDGDTFTPGGNGRPGDPPFPDGETDDREPIRVDATVGDPVAEPGNPQPPLPLTAPPEPGHPGQQTRPAATAVLDRPEGPPDMTTVATRGIQVTGIQSGAAECLSINKALEDAIAEFQTRLDQIASRVYAMGEATIGDVQFAGTSDVVTRMAQAAEATAAAKAAANACGTEVGPLLMMTRREFLRRA
jgi:hypothetical protein